MASASMHDTFTVPDEHVASLRYVYLQMIAEYARHNVACDEEFAGSLRQIRMVTGAVLNPLAGYLLLRGLATLPVRGGRAAATAAELAGRPDGHPG